MTGDNVTDRQWDDPLDFKEEGIVIDYKTAGVDIDAGKKFVEDLQKKVPALGGFGGMIKVPVGYKEPILVSGADESTRSRPSIQERKRHILLVSSQKKW